MARLRRPPTVVAQDARTGDFVEVALPAPMRVTLWDHVYSPLTLIAIVLLAPSLGAAFAHHAPVLGPAYAGWYYPPTRVNAWRYSDAGLTADTFASFIALISLAALIWRQIRDLGRGRDWGWYRYPLTYIALIGQLIDMFDNGR